MAYRSIRAPFNFVPLSDKVYFPEWADQVSQDIPFSDGLSGKIKLRITAESPIFIRNGHTEEDKEKNVDKYESFSHSDDGHFFIPGTSVKGAVRSVLEILSAGKISSVSNQSFGIRDLSNGDDGKFYRDKIKTENVRCGWLCEENGDYWLDDCGLPWRISMEEIDKRFHLGLEQFVKNGDFSKDENKSSKRKYDFARKAGLSELVGKFEPDEQLLASLKVGNRQFVRFSGSGEDGTIVFTGQPDKRRLKFNKGKQKWIGKYFEFVFPAKHCGRRKVYDSVYQDFVSVHKYSPDYEDLWKPKLMQGKKIPVFFMLDEENEVEAMGLAYMFRYPAYNNVFSSLRSDDLDNRMDLTECIFGKVEAENGLKGRVHFGHAWCDSNNPCQLDVRKLLLSTPHPSYYPLYLGGGKTWNSMDSRIAGWKRYPTRSSLSESTAGTDKMYSSLRALDSKTEFTETVTFFNLRSVELGALLAAITFEEDSSCRHSLGAAKSYGYGKARIEIESVEANDSFQVHDVIRSFIETVSPYRSDSSICELKAMARGIPEGRESEFTYMTMTNNKDTNEFLMGKDAYKEGEQLGTFSQIIGNSVPRTAFSGNVRADKKRENPLLAIEKQKQQEKQLQDSLAIINEDISNGDFVSAREHLKVAKNACVSNDAITELEERIERAEIEEQRRIEASRLEQEEIMRQAKEKERVEGGLSFLSEVNLKGEFKVNDFKGAKSRIETWMKKAQLSALPESQDALLEEFLARVFGGILKDKERRVWLSPGEGIWKDVGCWCGEDRSMKIFNKVIK